MEIPAMPTKLAVVGCKLRPLPATEQHAILSYETTILYSLVGMQITTKRLSPIAPVSSIREEMMQAIKALLSAIALATTSTLLPTVSVQAGATQAVINACYKHTQNRGYIVQQLLSSYGGGTYQTSKVTMRVQNRRNRLLYNATCEYNQGRIRLSQIVPISSGGGTNLRQYYERGYRQGQADARAGRRYDPIAGSYELRPELAREYTRGYADGYGSVEFGGEDPFATEKRRYYNEGYRQGQADARAGRRYDPIAGSYQLPPEFSREYTRGYGDGYTAAENLNTNGSGGYTGAQRDWYNRGYGAGRADALNSRPYDLNQDIYDNALQNNPPLRRAYSDGYRRGYYSVTQ
jgi:hypothetical protein